jgi:serine phosphatase RsbU (regulator of sigma subunit)
MYSDGLTEVQVSEGKLLGVDGVNKFMADAITGTPELKASDITARLMKHVAELETNLLPEDDRSFLVAKWMKV